MEKVDGHQGVYRRKDTKGVSSLYITYKIDQRKIWKVIGPESECTLAMAKDTRDRCVAAATPTDVQTLDSAFDYFRTSYAAMQLLKDTYRYTSAYNKHLRPLWGGMELSEITPVMVNTQKAVWLQDLAPSTVNQLLSLLSRIYIAVGPKFLGLYSGTSPVSMVKRLKFDNARLRFLTKEESLHLMDTLRNQNLQTYRQCAFSLYAGLRKTEVLTIRGANIDLENNILIIKTKDIKQGRMAALPIMPKLRAVIEDIYAEKYYAPNERLFPSDKFNYKAFGKAVDACGLNKDINWDDKNLAGDRFRVVLHTLRHSFASHLVAEGTPMEVVRRLMRHRNIATTERYSHVNDVQLNEAIDGLNSSWNEVIDAD